MHSEAKAIHAIYIFGRHILKCPSVYIAVIKCAFCRICQHCVSQYVMVNICSGHYAIISNIFYDAGICRQCLRHVVCSSNSYAHYGYVAADYVVSLICEIIKAMHICIRHVTKNTDMRISHNQRAMHWWGNDGVC